MPKTSEKPATAEATTTARTADPSNPTKDIADESDIDQLVREFYRRVSGHDRLGLMFNLHGEVDWYEHLPKMTAYWSRVLLGQPGFQGGSILGVHRALHSQAPLSGRLFDDWYGLWTIVIEEMYVGPTANKAKRHAAAIAKLLSRKILDQDWSPSRRTCP